MKRAIATAPGRATKLVNFTAKETAARNAEIAAFENERPTREWKELMGASDGFMSRVEEDMIEALDAAAKQRLNAEVMKKYNDKKALRAQKP